MTYAISGASGKLGRLAADQLLERMTLDEVVLTTRTPDALSAYRARGVEVRHADFDQPATLRGAFAGVEHLLLISARRSAREDEDPHREAISVAQACGVAHIVFTSMPYVDDPQHPVGWPAREYQRSEETLRSSGMAWTILRNGPYMELNVLERAPELFGTGRIATNAGEGRTAFISRRDCAAAAVAVLTSDGHEGRTYDVWGPEPLGWSEVARMLSETSGRDVAYVPLDDEEFADMARRGGMAEPMVQALTGMGVATRQGYFEGPPGVFEALTGRRPQRLRDVLAAHRDEIRRASR
jgi:NAD(P)H dehydrogenase (quinone)